MELKDFIGSIIIAVLFLLGVRMFSIVIPALSRAFERIKELKEQIRKAKEEERLKYEALIKQEPENFKHFGDPRSGHALWKRELIEDTICIDDVEDIELTKYQCEVCEKIILTESEIKQHMCDDCFDEEESDEIYTEEARNHVRTGDKNLRGHYDWLEDDDEPEEDKDE